MNKPWTISWASPEIAFEYRVYDIVTGLDIATFLGSDVESARDNVKSAKISIPVSIYGSRPVYLFASNAKGVETSSDASDIDFGDRPPQKPTNVTGESNKT